MRLIICLFLTFLLINPAYAFSSKIRKKKTHQKIKMVETKQDWEIEAENIPLSERKLDPEELPKTDKKNYFPQPHYVFELYNNPPGARNYDIRFIKKNLTEHPIMVADKECHYIAYANYYYRADNNQIYSDFYVEKLDTTKTKTARILEYNHKQLKRAPVLLSGFKEEYKNLYNGLSLVDWNSSGNKVLIKESIGSTLYGIYQNNLYVYFVDKDKTIKLSDFADTIVNHYLDSENLQLVKYRYILEPLGFSASNDNIIVANFYTYTKEGKKVFLGAWGYDLSENRIIILSKTNSQYSISANGLVLKRVLE